MIAEKVNYLKDSFSKSRIIKQAYRWKFRQFRPKVKLFIENRRFIIKTVDQTFTLARKVPGPEGWRHQDLRGIQDVPQAGHDEPEIFTYFKRVKGGDEFRANTEVLDKFFLNGQLDEQKVKRAAPGGEEDITFLIAPSRERALLLDKAYMALVKEQSFNLGRDTIISPPVNVHESITNGSTDLADSGQVYYDGRIWLNWDYSEPAVLGLNQ